MLEAAVLEAAAAADPRHAEPGHQSCDDITGLTTVVTMVQRIGGITGLMLLVAIRCQAAVLCAVPAVDGSNVAQGAVLDWEPALAPEL